MKKLEKENALNAKYTVLNGIINLLPEAFSEYVLIVGKPKISESEGCYFVDYNIITNKSVSTADKLLMQNFIESSWTLRKPRFAVIGTDMLLIVNFKHKKQTKTIYIDLHI